MQPNPTDTKVDIFFETAKKHSDKMDKVKHFGVSAAIAAASAVVFMAFHVGALVACVGGFMCAVFCGIGKEYGDHAAPGNRWDWYDMLADVMGAAVGCCAGLFALI